MVEFEKALDDDTDDNGAAAVIDGQFTLLLIDKNDLDIFERFNARCILREERIVTIIRLWYGV